MAREREGNATVKHSEAEEKFAAGDIVAIKPSVLRSRMQLTPKSLYRIGHPNKFLVFSTFVHEEKGPCVALTSCCSIPGMAFGFEDPEDRSKPLCSGHPYRHFEKVGIHRLPQKGDKSASFSTFLGDIFRLDWEEDEHNPKLAVEVFGVKLGSASGPLAKFMKGMAEDGKIL